MTNAVVLDAPAVEHNGKEHALVEAAEAPYLLQGEHTQRVIRYIDRLWDKGLTPMLWGSPGVGKTALIEAMAKRPNCAGMIRVLLGSADKADTLGMPNRGTFEGKHGTYNVTIHAAPDWAVQAAETDEDKHFIVFLDEIPQAEVDVQGTFLTVLANRVMPSGLKLGNHVKFVAAGNPTSEVSSGFELIEPLQNRLGHITYEPPKDEWISGMKDAWGHQVDADELSLRAMIGGYILCNDDKKLHCAPPTGGKENAWPSRRSWDNFAKVGAPDIGDKDALRFYAESFLGEAVAVDFITQVFLLERHDPADIVADPSIIDWRNPLANYYSLSAVVSWVTEPSRLADAIGVINYAAGNGPADMAALALKDWAVKVSTVRDTQERLKYVKMIDGDKLGSFMKLLFA